MKQPVFFDVELRPAQLGRPEDHLEAFSRIMDFKVFRPLLKRYSLTLMAAKAGVHCLIRY